MALQKINLIIPDDLKVDVIVPNVILGGADDYNKLANLPTFNGKEWKGPLTFESENIASKSELAALAGKVNTNKNDIDGLGDQIHEVEAKIPQAASDSNQLVDKASMTSAIAAVQKGVDDNAGDIAALQADLSGKQDKGDYATKAFVTNAVKSVSGGAGITTDDGIKGDYCSTYGILAAPNGVLTANGMKLTLKAGLVLQCAGQEAKTTIASDTVHEVESTQDFDFFYADGAFYEATQVVYSRTEPENGATGILAWWNPDVKKWKFKSNAAGNVWATANKAARLAHIHTDGTTITRIDYIGARVLDEGRLLQGLKKTVADLATGADSAAVIAKVNEILAALREAGILA